MEHYVGLDVSLKLTAIRIVDRTGKIQREGVVHSDPEAIAAFIKSTRRMSRGSDSKREQTSTWLWTELNKLGLPVIYDCVRTFNGCLDESRLISAAEFAHHFDQIRSASPQRGLSELC
jgi:hypothetical protein